MRTSIASALVLVALGFGLTAPAGATVSRVNPPAEETFRTTVHYGDLNLQTRQGADALYSRLSMAAGRVCEDAGDIYVRLTHSYQECRHEAVSDAVREINSPLVTQAFEQHAPKELGVAHHTTPSRAPHA
jgi:UrcA family protein